MLWFERFWSVSAIIPLINGLNRAVGRAHDASSEVIEESALSFGDVFALHELWQDLGIDKGLNRAVC